MNFMAELNLLYFTEPALARTRLPVICFLYFNLIVYLVYMSSVNHSTSVDKSVTSSVTLHSSLGSYGRAKRKIDLNIPVSKRFSKI